MVVVEEEEVENEARGGRESGSGHGLSRLLLIGDGWFT